MLQTQTEFTHNQLAKKTDIPKGNGTTVNFRRIVKLTPKLDANGMPIPLTEGVTPDGLNASVTAITASTLPYGDYVLFSDMVDWAHQIQSLRVLERNGTNCKRKIRHCLP